MIESRTTEVPFGIARLVDILEDGNGPIEIADDEESQGDSKVKEAEEVFFPLRANDQQRGIVRQMESKSGVLVQGPPGTGKSQTIANLICHLLATGKRVLVTSETARALAVLKEKLPDDVKPLCVSLLGADQNSFSELDGAVLGISNRHSQWNSETQEALGRSINSLKRELSRQKQRKAEVQRTLRELREAGTKSITLVDGTYIGTASEIAKRVCSENQTFQWVKPVDASDPKPPMTNSEITDLFKLWQEFATGDVSEIRSKIVDVEKIPSPAEFARCAKAIEEARQALDKYRNLMEEPSVRGLLSAGPSSRNILTTDIRAFIAYFDNLSNRGESWLPDAIKEVLADRDLPWHARAKTTLEALKVVKPAAEQYEGVSIRLPEEYSEERVLSDALIVIEHLSTGGRWSILGISPRKLRGRQYFRNRVFVDGQNASSLEKLQIVVSILETRRRAFDAGVLWRLNLSSEAISLRTTWAAELEECLEAINIVFNLHDLARSIAGQLKEFNPPVPLPQWSRAGFEVLINTCEAANAIDEAKRASALFDPARRLLEDVVASQGSHAVNRGLLDRINSCNTQAWAENYALALLLWSKQTRFAKRSILVEQITKFAPDLWNRLKETPDDLQWLSKLASFEEAWRWSYADKWLANFRDPNSVKNLENELRICDKHIADSLARLAADKAWFNLLSKLTEKQKQNLLSFSFNTKRGRGSGIMASKSREAARKNIEECIGAIPVWIMPRYRVVEAFDPKPNLFDVVIVDEASQTGIEGLFLYGLAKQVLIVGDDQQISPSDIGIPLEKVQALARHFLWDNPFPLTFTPKVSLYAHAKIRFGGVNVLREHFRCVPEIIGFSDQLCYAPNGTPLIPLRNYEPARMDPILTRFVREGFQEGKASSAVNRPEAQALVAQLIACANDPRYKGKTFGVISLLGESQARLIERLLLSALGPEQMEERRLVCGDAYAFQGDERHVIFLSMVSAPNARIGPLAGQEALQRFNVAVSRAQDQLWLFHSAASEDLSESCVRRKLLFYCLNPNDPEPEQEPHFDSGFERDVYERIKQRGYRVRTQVAGGDQTSYRYRIDMVVEGDSQRLAVECDGDEWHGIESYEADMHRQRQLERAGWIFYRIWGGDFYRDPDMALESLWRELDRLGIDPRGDHRSRTTPPPPADDTATNFDLDVDFGIAPEVEAETEAIEDIKEESTTDIALKNTEIATMQVPPAISSKDKLEPSETGLNKEENVSRANTNTTTIPSGDNKQLEYFDSVPLMDWADLAQWAESRSQWDLTKKNLIKRVAKALAAGKTLPDHQRIWAARLHSLACRIGFHPHPPVTMETNASGQGKLPFDREGKPN